MWSIVLSLRGRQLAISVYPGKCPQNPAVGSKWNSFSVLLRKPCWFSWPLIPLPFPVSPVTVLVSFFLSFLGATQRQSPGMLYWKLWSTQMKVFPFHVGLLSPSLLRPGLCRGLLQERPLLQAPVSCFISLPLVMAHITSLSPIRLFCLFLFGTLNLLHVFIYFPVFWEWLGTCTQLPLAIL